MFLDRFESLIGDDINKIKELNILLIGIGGVGGYTFSSLVRSGVNNITIVDPDKFDITNLNRQILSNINNIGNYKVYEALKRAKEINPYINITVIKEFLDINNIDIIFSSKFDYVIDACDTLNSKVLIIKKCKCENIKVISCMGTARKLDASKLSISKLNKTTYDKLAAVLRSKLSTEEQKYVTVVSSCEEVKANKELGSTSYVPGVAGLLITNYIINDVLKK
ncbi:MAG: ThiF family adenylyltransferase [Bacilli bacterium]